MPKTLYPYQRDGLAAFTGKERELCVLPTGGGKTFMFAKKAIAFLAKNPNLRVVILVHTDELVQQAYEAVLEAVHEAHKALQVGIVKASRRDTFADIIVASVQTLRQPKALATVTQVGLIITDEADLSLAASYMTIFTHFGAFDGKVEMAGFTATPFRADGKSLYPLWQKVVFQRDISWMVRRGYLIPPKGKAVEVPDLDLRNVKSTKADYRDGDLGEALADSLAPEKIVEAWDLHAWITDEHGNQRRRKTLGFAPTVASAYILAEAFNEAGIRAEVVHGGLPKDERRRILAEHKAGKFHILFNCQILTVGYDDQGVECIIMARPTKSKRLYIQIIGRGIRVDRSWPKELQDCLVLDVVGINAIHGDLRSIADLSDRPLKEKDVHSGRSLVDLEDEFDAGDGVEPDAPEFYTGDVIVRDFDVLGGASSKVWLKTKGGVFYVPAGTEMYVFIMQYPTPDHWSVSWATVKHGDRRYECGEGEEGVPRKTCTCGKKCAGRPVGMTVHRGLPLDVAMVMAEDLAVDLGTDLNTSKRNAPWRRKPASTKLIGYARGLGIPLTEITDPASGLVTGVQERMGEVSDRVSVVNASRRLDPIVKAVYDRQAKR